MQAIDIIIKLLVHQAEFAISIENGGHEQSGSEILFPEQVVQISASFLQVLH